MAALRCRSARAPSFSLLLLAVLLLAALALVAAPARAEAGGAAPADYSKLRIKALQELLTSRGLECKGCSEKADLIDLLTKADADPAAYPPKQPADAAADADADAPPEAEAPPKAAEKKKPAAEKKTASSSKPAAKKTASAPAADTGDKSRDEELDDVMRKLQGSGMGNFKMYKREDMQKMAKDMEQKAAFKDKQRKAGKKVDDDDMSDFDL